MRSLLLAGAALLLGLSGCGPQTPVASSQYCDDYARTQGPAYAYGGPRTVRDPEVLRLPGQPPVWLRGFGESEVVAHLNQEDALRAYCMRDLTPG
jgi:hypothetical protein